MALKVALVSGQRSETAKLEYFLGKNNFFVTAKFLAAEQFGNASEINDVDVIVICIRIPEANIFQQMALINKSVNPKPIIVFSKQGDQKTIEQATKAGAISYVVDNLETTRIKPIIDVAMSRFNALQALKNELDETRKRLEDRKIVERAKGLLMRKRQINEDEAYRLLQKLAMSQNKKIGSVAKNIVAMADLLG